MLYNVFIVSLAFNEKCPMMKREWSEEAWTTDYDWTLFTVVILCKCYTSIIIKYRKKTEWSHSTLSLTQIFIVYNNSEGATHVTKNITE